MIHLNNCNCAEEEMLSPITKIYIDVEYIQDLLVGALLLLWKQTKSESDYTYFIQQLPSYNNRLTFDTMHYFPKWKNRIATNESLDAFIRNEKNIRQLLLNAPYTDVACYLKDHHKLYKEQNNRLGEKHPKPITYNVNVYPLPINEDVIQFFQYRMKALIEDNSIIINVLSKPIQSLNTAFFKNTYTAYMYRFTDMTTQEYSPCYLAYYHHLVFKNTTVATPFRITLKESLKDDLVYRYTERQLEESCSATLLTMSVFSDFKFVNPKIHIKTE
mgnify:CR=1 FL=1|jgi:hypothetical protein